MVGKCGSAWGLPVKLPVIPAKAGALLSRHYYKIPIRRTDAFAGMTRGRHEIPAFAGMTDLVG